MALKWQWILGVIGNLHHFPTLFMKSMHNIQRFHVRCCYITLWTIILPSVSDTLSINIGFSIWCLNTFISDSAARRAYFVLDKVFNTCDSWKYKHHTHKVCWKNKVIVKYMIFLLTNGQLVGRNTVKKGLVRNEMNAKITAFIKSITHAT